MTVAEAVRELTEAIKEAQLELPGVSIDDVGKILMVDAEGKWVAILPTPELPDTTGASEGDVLTVGSSTIGWAHPAVELPDATGVTEGYVLTVGSSGLEWGEAGGGLTLYGPYVGYASTDVTVSANDYGTEYIDTIEDLRGDYNYTFPDEADINLFVIPVGFHNQTEGIILASDVPPYTETLSLTIYNPTSSSIDFNASVMFYTSKELSLAQSEGE